LTELPGSPFPAGADAAFEGGVTYRDRIVACEEKSLLFVSNFPSRDVSAYVIDPTTGDLTPVPGSPFLLNEGGPKSLAVTPDCQFLMVYARIDFVARGITVFRISSDGSLNPIAGSPIPVLASNAMKVTRDGRFLALGGGRGGIFMFNIAMNGSLTPVLGSPFPLTLRRTPAQIDINCESDLLYAAIPNGNAISDFIDGQEIAPDGSLRPAAGFPIESDAPGPLYLTLGPNDNHIFTTNSNATHSVYDVSADGGLVPIVGSPFPPQAPPFFLGSLATNASGTLLYSTAFTIDVFASTVSVFNVDSDGSLTPAPGSPVPIPNADLFNSAAAFPPKSCGIDVSVDIRPSSDTNPINPSLEGDLPVAILGSDSFDVVDVDVNTLAFGPDGASFDHSHGPHFEDVNGDGFTDLLVHFQIVETGIAFGNRKACVSGETLDGTPFSGCDAVRTVPDMDGDALLDVEEAAIGTDALNSDSDWDGYDDAEEVLELGTDPLDPLDPTPDPVPEPASWLMLIAGAAFLGLLYRRRVRGLQFV
jgi:6-phosphogluconolactonase (cycloisomerase 2 family)